MEELYQNLLDLAVEYRVRNNSF
ncbi:protein of unknown function (plasmid) [Caballeronia sp. S22]